ncbi:inositol monophosphatase family protein [[Mycobacterium] kokjensenii]|uniref:3'(2'),5-bisphosphonucleoside 3'(2')-phosphohydrolase n=1 Tax=[Mycobacterium] kokjensenii TaxID=3064287 RepID=A0ABM9LDS7_9MYCO|nr:inositol monophosphatase family protein [Mycolicibacter sp. MU0083]CAJ1497348.1 inositol monophosphatase family protein [Mycolicibacter sp. MU0083]
MTLTDAALAAELAVDAGKLLLAVRDEVGFEQPWHLGDTGDGMANQLILRGLREARPDDAVLSEESPDNLKRLNADRVWIIDPLDGTREFTMRGREDWAVHIALWQRGGAGGAGAITDAAVSLPAYENRSNVVFRTDTVADHPRAAETPDPIRIAVSASRMPGFVRILREVLPVEPVLMGSAGAKAMAVVRGDVDAYLHAGGQWEWDSAAPAGVVLAAGLHASRIDGSPLRYNRPDPYLPDLLMCRPDVAPLLLDAIRQTVL